MRDRKGFTLIELLIVVVIIGILAAIAIPKFAATREKAYVSTLKSDLRNMATQQEIYYADNYEYTTDNGAVGFTLSDGVESVAVTVSSDPDGFTAVATHDSGITCTMDASGAASSVITCSTDAVTP